jgi:hypothetical protein
MDNPFWYLFYCGILKKTFENGKYLLSFARFFYLPKRIINELK